MIIKTVIVFTIFVILFVLFFNRHPEINIGKINNNEVLSPSYGTIKKIIKSNNRITIIIFLSPLDIHVQYYPIYGKVISQVHDLNGKYELAYKLNKSNENEKVIRNKRVNAKCTATPLAQPTYTDLLSMDICLTNNSPMPEGPA
jgi:phosphatidylserine decarboxylase